LESFLDKNCYIWLKVEGYKVESYLTSTLNFQPLTLKIKHQKNEEKNN